MSASAPRKLEYIDCRHFFYLFINFFVYLLFGSLANIKALAKDTTQIAHIIAEKLPQFARFYINLIILQGNPQMDLVNIRRWNVPIPSTPIRTVICVSIRSCGLQNTSRFPRIEESFDFQFRHVSTTANSGINTLLELQCDETSHPCRWSSILLYWLLCLQIPAPLRYMTLCLHLTDSNGSSTTQYRSIMDHDHPPHHSRHGILPNRHDRSPLPPKSLHPLNPHPPLAHPNSLSPGIQHR